MKDSGIPWIGEIPCHWEIQRLQTQLYELNEKNTPIKTDYVLSLTNTRGVIPYTEKGDVGNKAKENHEEYKIAYPNTIVANSMNILIGSVGICNYYGCVSPVYYILKERSGTDLRFYNYVLSCVPFQKHLRQYANGILEIRLRLSCKDILQRRVPTPSYLEQQSIADFLDKKCGEIDEMVSLQEKIVEELKAYKQSVITEAVCKGLNPDVPMKDSGIEWIGQIPEGWKVSRVGLHYSIILGKMLCDKPIEGGALVPYFCAANVHFDGIGAEELKRMWFSKEEQEKYRVQVGDLLVVEGGAGAGGCAIVHNLSHNTFIQNSIMIVRSVSHDCRFLKYLLERLVKQGYVDYVCNKATIPHFTKDKLSQVPFAFPSREEQQDIADYLDTKCTEINILISVRQAKIEALKEYKKSIIYEYITGKKEING